MFGNKARKAVGKEGAPVGGFHWGDNIFELADGRVVHDEEAAGVVPGAHCTVRAHPSYPDIGILERSEPSAHLTHGRVGSATVLAVAAGPFGMQRLDLDVLLGDGTRQRARTLTKLHQPAVPGRIGRAWVVTGRPEALMGSGAVKRDVTALIRGRDGHAGVARASPVAIHPTGARCAQFGMTENYVDYLLTPLDGSQPWYDRLVAWDTEPVPGRESLAVFERDRASTPVYIHSSEPGADFNYLHMGLMALGTATTVHHA